MTTDARTDQLRRFAIVVWSVIGVLVLGWAALMVADSVRIIWLPLAFAAGLAFMLNPLVDRLERARVPRLVGTILAFLLAAGVMTAVAVLLVPPIRQQASEFSAQVPSLYDSVVDQLRVISNSLGVDLGPVWTSETIRAWIADPANQVTLQELLGGFGSGAGRILRGVTETLAVVVLAPVLSFYLVMDASRFKRQARDLTPPRHREEVTYVGRQLGTAMGSFVRGQLLVAAFVGVFSSLGMYLIDLPFWLIVGGIAGVLNLIPFVGPFVGGALAAVVALFNGSLSQAVWAVLIFTAVQQTDNHVITPLIHRTRVHLSPLVIVLALIVGGAVAGLLGVLIAVPTTAAVRIVAGHLWRTRMLGESWQEASDAMIEVTEPPERLTAVRRRRDNQDQERLFDTAETRVVVEESDPPT